MSVALSAEVGYLAFISSAARPCCPCSCKSKQYMVLPRVCFYTHLREAPSSKDAAGPPLLAEQLGSHGVPMKPYPVKQQCWGLQKPPPLGDGAGSEVGRDENRQAQYQASYRTSGKRVISLVRCRPRALLVQDAIIFCTLHARPVRTLFLGAHIDHS